MKRLSLLTLLLIATLAGADAPDPPQSIYQLDAHLMDQAGVEHGLDVYRDHPVLITMFYGSCPAACPLLIDTLRAVERAAAPAQRAQLRVLMISIDPQRDTTSSLQTLAQARHIDASRWTVAGTDTATVRKIAAVLNIQYRRLPDGDFNHSSVISLLSPEGEITRQSAVLGKADPELMQALTSSIP